MWLIQLGNLSVIHYSCSLLVSQIFCALHGKIYYFRFQRSCACLIFAICSGVIHENLEMAKIFIAFCKLIFGYQLWFCTRLFICSFVTLLRFPHMSRQILMGLIWHLVETWWNPRLDYLLVTSHWIHCLIFYFFFDKQTIYGLTHCAVVTPYGNTDLGQHWLR